MLGIISHNPVEGQGRGADDGEGAGFGGDDGEGDGPPGCGSVGEEVAAEGAVGSGFTRGFAVAAETKAEEGSLQGGAVNITGAAKLLINTGKRIVGAPNSSETRLNRRW